MPLPDCRAGCHTLGLSETGRQTLPFIEANGVSFHYKIEGASGPTVILLHEIGGSLDSWDGVVPDLAKRFRVFRYDQRGFGRSEERRVGKESRSRGSPDH